MIIINNIKLKIIYFKYLILIIILQIKKTNSFKIIILNKILQNFIKYFYNYFNNI